VDVLVTLLKQDIGATFPLLSDFKRKTVRDYGILPAAAPVLREICAKTTSAAQRSRRVGRAPDQ
jgi:peroxiredoxin